MKKLFNWKGVLVLTLVVGVVAGIAVGLVTEQGWAGTIVSLTVAIAPNVAFNWKTLREWKDGVFETARVGWKQMKVVQLQKEDRIQRLLTLEILQIDNLDSYFRTVVDSVNYRKLQSNVPKVILKVKFFNLSVFKWKINSWELVLDYNPNDYQVNCKQHPYNLRRQGDRLNTKLESCQPGNCDVELELDNTVAECIRQAAAERSLVYYQVHLTWQMETEDGRIGKHHYLDYLSHADIPNLSQ